MSETPQIVVVGSANMDLVVRTERPPRPGETVQGSEFHVIPGGKGANQAVAAARQGARTAFVGRVGDDAFGARLREGLAAEGVDTSFLKTTPDVPSGVAVITLDGAGQNSIVIAPGANGRLSMADIDEARGLIAAADMLVCQLEIPFAAVVRAMETAREAGTAVAFNPAPASPLGPEVLSLADHLVVNESEAALLSGLAVENAAGAERAAARLCELGAETVLATLGGDGVVVAGREGVFHEPAQRVDVVDTTAAGDTFMGAFAAAIIRGEPLRGAVGVAQRAAALAVSRLGAQPSIPTLEEMRMGDRGAS